MYCAFHTPRISYGDLKTVIGACPWGPRDRRGVCYRAGQCGGWVPGGCYTGYYTGLGTLPQPSRILPSCYIGIARAQPVPETALSASAGHSRPLLGPPHTRLLALSMALQDPIKGEIQYIYLKVSQ